MPNDDATDVAALLAFLRDHDARCPICGYNVRGLTRPTCPECEQPLALTVGAANLRFGWLFLTVAPCIFSGIAAGLMTLPIVLAPYLVGAPGNPTRFIVLLVAFGWASGATGVGLYLARRRFLRQLPDHQMVWAAMTWGLHVAAFLVMLAHRF